jgi:hypothetical protein
MKGHIFIKTNDKLWTAVERAPDNLLHTTAKKNPNKQTNKQTPCSRALLLAEAGLVKKSPSL